MEGFLHPSLGWVTEVRWAYENKWPRIIISFSNGNVARPPAEQKLIEYYNLPYVYLGLERDDPTVRCRIPAILEHGIESQVLEGFTDHPMIVERVKDYLLALRIEGFSPWWITYNPNGGVTDAGEDDEWTPPDPERFEPYREWKPRSRRP